MPQVMIDTEVEAEDAEEALMLAMDAFQEWASAESNFAVEPTP
jgi:hypothetical protein